MSLTNLVKKSLSSKYNVVSALTPDEALRHMEKEPLPDIIVCDLYLIEPQEEGIEVGLNFLERIRQKPEISHIPVLVYSKYADSLAHPGKYKKIGMRFGIDRKWYTWQELVKFKDRLEGIGIDGSSIQNKFETAPQDLVSKIDDILTTAEEENHHDKNP